LVVSPEVTAARLRRLDRCVQRLRRLAEMPRESYLADEDAKALAERHFQGEESLEAVAAGLKVPVGRLADVKDEVVEGKGRLEIASQEKEEAFHGLGCGAPTGAGEAVYVAAEGIGLAGEGQMGAQDQIRTRIGHDRTIGSLDSSSLIHTVDIRSMKTPGNAYRNHGPVEPDKKGIPVLDLLGRREDHHLEGSKIFHYPCFLHRNSPRFSAPSFFRYSARFSTPYTHSSRNFWNPSTVFEADP